jgi:tetratricopeptide (TPR) repeat protein
VNVHVNITVKRREENKPSESSGPGVVSANELNQKVPGAARKEYEKAVKLSSQSKLQEAVDHLRRAVALYPDYIMAWNTLGIQYLKLKQLDDAASCLNKALEKEPKYFDSRFNLGLVRIEQKNYSDAIAQFSQAIVIDSSQPGAHLWLGFAMLQTNQLPEAENELLKALVGSNSAFVAAHFYLAQVYVKRGDLNEATRALNAYLENAPNGEYAVDSKQLLKKIETRNRSASRP